MFTAQSTPSAFGQFFEQQGGKEHFLPFMQEFRSIDIQHIRDIKRNKFKPGNIVKLSTSIRRTGEIAKNVKLDLSGLKIETREEDCTVADAKSIVSLLRSFLVYKQTLLFLAPSGVQFQLNLALDKYTEDLFVEVYQWRTVHRLLYIIQSPDLR